MLKIVPCGPQCVAADLPLPGGSEHVACPAPSRCAKCDSNPSDPTSERGWCADCELLR